MRLVRHDGNNSTVFSAALSVVAVEPDILTHGSHIDRELEVRCFSYAVMLIFHVWPNIPQPCIFYSYSYLFKQVF